MAGIDVFNYATKYATEKKKHISTVTKSSLMNVYRLTISKRLHGSPQFSLWIPIALAKIYFLCMFLIWLNSSNGTT